jgi:hypothetical protein
MLLDFPISISVLAPRRPYGTEPMMFDLDRFIWSIQRCVCGVVDECHRKDPARNPSNPDFPGVPGLASRLSNLQLG